MSLPLACVWWPQAPAERHAANWRWLHDWTPYATAAAELGPNVFFLAAAGLEGLFVSQQAWAAALLQALAAGRSQAYLALGHHRQALWTLVRAAAFDDATAMGTPQAKLVAAHPSPAVEQATAGQVRLAALGLPANTVQAAAAMRVHTLGQAKHLSLESVQGHFGAPLAHWLRALRQPSPPLSRKVPSEPVLAGTELTAPSANSDQLLFFLKRLLGEVLTAAKAQRRVVAALHLHVRYEGRSPPPPLLRRLEAAVASLDEPRWLRLLQLSLGYTALAAPACALRLQADVVLPPPAEQLLLWPTAATGRMRAACEALAKVQSAWGAKAVTLAQLVDAHLPEEQFVWQPWQGQSLPAAKPRAARAAAPQAAGRAPRVRLCWPTARAVPNDLKRWLREQKRWPALAAAMAPGEQAHAAVAAAASGESAALALASTRQQPAGWLRGPFVFNLYWWTEQPCDRDYWYVCPAPQAAVHWLFYDRRRREWRWQGQLD